jgi:hypothetical protein
VTSSGGEDAALILGAIGTATGLGSLTLQALGWFRSGPRVQVHVRYEMIVVNDELHDVAAVVVHNKGRSSAQVAAVTPVYTNEFGVIVDTTMRPVGDVTELPHTIEPRHQAKWHYWWPDFYATDEVWAEVELGTGRVIPARDRISWPAKRVGLRQRLRAWTRPSRPSLSQPPQ